MSKYVGKIVTNQAPAGYSVAFDGNGDRLSLATNTALDLTGDFTFECWIYPTVLNTYHIIFDTSLSGTAGSNMTEFWIVAPSGIEYYARGSILLSGTGVVTNRWQHVAITKAGTTQRLFLNGIIVASTTSSTQPNTGYTWAIGDRPAGAGSAQYPFTGNISGLRVVKGTALYTAAFTPPTQLLNVTNTSLLTCNSPAIIDQSSNALPIITEGNAAVSTFTPFAAYNPVPTSANPLTPAPGVWTLDEALQYTQQGVWPSYPANAIEDVFSTYLYTGNGSTQTITNGIDLSTYGGLVWSKSRTSAASHYLVDTARGRSSGISTNSTGARLISSAGNDLASFTTTGYTLGPVEQWSSSNSNGDNIVSWTFRKQAKFFDIVTYTGNGSATRTISHNLGSTPGFIIIKETSAIDDWCVLAGDSSGNYQYLYFNTAASSGSVAKSSVATSTTIDIAPIRANYGTNAVNESSQTYVMYLFASDAGGFGATGADNVISCGSVTNTTTVNLGYEPQWIMVKRTDSTSPWYIVDNMRGMNASYGDYSLSANSAGAETLAGLVAINATGMTLAVVGTYIYIAIRRGPMRPPTSGTSVFSTSTYSPNTGTITSGFPTDFIMTLDRATGTAPWNRGFADRLRGRFLTLSSASSGSENTNTSTTSFDSNTGTILNGGGVYGSSYVYEQFRRAPGFFDEVCYTGTGVTDRVVAHNLTIPPELIITKNRSISQPWAVGTSFTSTGYRWMYLNLTDAAFNLQYSAKSRINSQPTSTQYVIATDSEINGSGNNYVAYLFATVGGVSKVGSYTGTGTTQQINCGFTNGSRFVMIKRTDSTGDWYVWDSARGIVAGNDPYLLLNNTNAEVTNTDFVDTYSLGFELSSTAPAALNASGGSYIFLAIA